nr:aldo/keto reductase [Ruminococcus sp. OA3]
MNQRTKDKISILGVGSSCISEASEKEAVQALEMAVEQGVNYFDMAAGAAGCFSYYGKALERVRKNIFYQIHFGADYATGEYGWTTRLDTVKASLDWQLGQLKTDYIDYGFIHCLDEESDWNAYQKEGVLAYIQRLKEQGVVKHIGLSSHTPGMVHKALDTGLVDMLMFSINPGYDYQHGELANGSTSERMELYRRCEAEGVGISVMKAFSAGQLLDEKSSPFGKALTEYQCIQYALDMPGVLTVLPGIRGVKDMKRILGFLDASKKEKDYSVLAALTPQVTDGTCVYCNHCQPCPAGLNVGLINKYYDLARSGDALAKGHYEKLQKKAEDCIGCGHCDQRCPFHVKQTFKMEQIAAYFKE